MKMKKEVFSYLRDNREFGISCIKLEKKIKIFSKKKRFFSYSVFNLNSNKNQNLSK